MGVNPNIWRDRRVLVTGHTGFKGAWFVQWLHAMGAQVSGLSLAPETDPNLWALLKLDTISSHEGDIRDVATLDRVLAVENPDVVFHLAAQSLVRRSYREPLDTFSTNVMGTAALLDAITRAPSVEACVIVTSDKCYENQERSEGYVESDPMGGFDPYSASKGCTELVTASMRRSFFAPSAPTGHACRIASARAGNVIGGGDWSEDRLVPDIVRGCLSGDGNVVIRSPNSLRPWQHVLEPLRGYLMLAQSLLAGDEGADSGWNLGPITGQERPVIDVAQAIVDALGVGQLDVQENPNAPHEAKLLSLVSDRARTLGWEPSLDFQTTIDLTAKWYADWAQGVDPHTLCLAQIQQFSLVSGD